MATAGYEGGIGGKLRRRPQRRAAATPYDRPPAVVRGHRGRLAGAGAGGSGWLSKLVDPASRFIANSASRVFSSVFGKRLPVLPEAPEGNHQSSQEVPEVACTLQDPSSKLLENGRNDEVKPTNNPGTSGISELEELLKQKTFTRVEVDHLTQLLLSRTIDPDMSKLTVDEQKEETIVSAQDNGVGGSKALQDFSTSLENLTIPVDEAASPAELAKVYMGSRSSKVPSSALRLWSQVFHGDKTMPSNAQYVSKPFDPSVMPKSVVRFSGNPDFPENGYMTPKPRGRSAIYRMSCSPYFKVHPTTNIKGVGPSNNFAPGPSSSHPSLASMTRSGGRQVSKLGISALDSDFGSAGPIRRIHQKSNMISPTKDIHSKLPGNLLASPLTPLDKGFIQGYSASANTTVGLDDQKHDNIDLQTSENGDKRKSDGSITPIPLQSSETAWKILQQLDKLMPSPKERSFGPHTFSRGESPSKLMHTKLRGQVFENMEDIDSSKSLHEQDCVNLDAASDSPLLGVRNTLSQSRVRVEENDVIKSSVFGVKSASEGNVMDGAPICVTDSMPGNSSAYVWISYSAAITSQKNPAFKMIAPEASTELDDDNNNKDTSIRANTIEDKIEAKILKCKDVISESATAERFLISSANYMPSSSSIATGEAHMKASVGLAVSENSTGFMFPVAPPPSAHSQPPPKLVMLSPLLDRSTYQKEQLSSPFSLGPQTFTFSSTMSTKGFSDAAGLKIGASNDTSSIVVGNSKLNISGEMQQGGDLNKSVGTAVSSGISTSIIPAAFVFGASTTPSLSNGSLHSSSNFSVSGAPAVTLSDGTVSTIFSTNPFTATTSNDSSISPAAPNFPTVPALQFGSCTSKRSPISVSPPGDKSDNIDLGAKPAKLSPFSSNSSTALGDTFAFSSTGSNISSPLTIPSALSSSGSNSSVVATVCACSSIGGSSTASASAMSASQSILAPSSEFSRTVSLFGFSASGHSSSSSSSVAVNNSQNLAVSFGATDGSIFGPQSTQHISQGSKSPLGSFSSTPAFGLSASSSSGFFSSPFGQATMGTESFSSSSVFSVPSTSSIFGTSFGSSASTPSTGFIFGLSTSAPGGSFTFGSSSGSIFPFTSAGSTTSASFISAQPVFGMTTAAVGLSSGSTGNDQMNVEDSMADDTKQAAVSIVSTFGQPSSSLVAPLFGAPAIPPSGSPIFHFGSHQNSSIPQNPSSFQAAGNLEFPPGGSFSLGSGGGDKSGRKYVKVRRDKLRKK